MGVATLQRPTTQPRMLGRYHWTVDSFYRAIDPGVFDEPKRMELVHGDLWEKEKVNPPHASLTHRIAGLLRKLFEDEYVIREKKPIRLATDGEPMPDVCIARGDEEAFEERHPNQSDVCLIIEVADASEDRDTGEKADLYAEAGITDYWVVVVNKREIQIFRNANAGAFPKPTIRKAGDTVAPLFAPNVSLAVSDFLPRPKATP